MSFDPVPGLLRSLRQRRVIGFFWLCRALAAWIIAAPIAALLSGQGVGRYPQGDALLFAPGALHLAEAVRLGLPQMAETLRTSLMSAGFFGYLLLIPLAGMCAALTSDTPTTVGWSIARGLERLPKFTLLAGLTLFCQGLVAALGIYGLDALQERVSSTAWSERSRDLWLLSGIGLLVVLLVSLGVVQDIARTALASGQRSLFIAIMAAFQTIRKRPFDLAVAWSISVIWSWVLVAAIAIVVGRLDVSSGSLLVFALVALFHQGVALVLVLLRATWLARAFELTVAIAPERR